MYRWAGTARGAPGRQQAVERMLPPRHMPETGSQAQLPEARPPRSRSCPRPAPRPEQRRAPQARQPGPGGRAGRQRARPRTRAARRLAAPAALPGRPAQECLTYTATSRVHRACPVPGLQYVAAAWAQTRAA